MKIPSFLLVIGLGASIVPQTVVSAEKAGPPSDVAAVNAQRKALEFRTELTNRIIDAGEEPAAVLERLKGHGSPSGLGLDHEVEYAFAAVDIGQRLISLRRPADAEIFFREGEAALGRALEKLDAEEQTHETVLVLRKRGIVRGRFLGKFVEAKTDFEEAIRLRPDDKAIVQQRDTLLSGYGEPNRPQAETLN